jgi:hypothetical protein
MSWPFFCASATTASALVKVKVSLVPSVASCWLVDYLRTGWIGTGTDPFHAISLRERSPEYQNWGQRIQTGRCAQE